MQTKNRTFQAVLAEQMVDRVYRAGAQTVRFAGSNYLLHEDGVLVWQSPIYEAVKRVEPVSIQ